MVRVVVVAAAAAVDDNDNDNDNDNNDDDDVVMGIRLVPIEDKHTKKLTGSLVERSLVQAVVAPRSPLTRQPIKELRFRTHYDAVILTVSRAGERLNQQIGNTLVAT